MVKLTQKSHKIKSKQNKLKINTLPTRKKEGGSERGGRFPTLRKPTKRPTLHSTHWY